MDVGGGSICTCTSGFGGLFCQTDTSCEELYVSARRSGSIFSPDWGLRISATEDVNTAAVTAFVSFGAPDIFGSDVFETGYDKLSVTVRGARSGPTSVSNQPSDVMERTHGYTSCLAIRESLTHVFGRYGI